MAKVKFGQRIMRAFVYGIGSGFVLYLLGGLANAILKTNINLGLAGFVIGLGMATGIELSKDMEME